MSEGAEKRRYLLPRWMAVESTMRKVLMLRKAGHAMADIARECGFSKSSISQVRRVAQGQAHFPGDVLVAQAFMRRLETIGPPVPYFRQRAALYSEKGAAKVAREIERWKIDMPPEGAD